MNQMTIPNAMIEQICTETEASAEDVRKICDSFLSTLVANVKEGKNVSFKNALSFKRVLRADRNHKKPKTDEVIFKKAHYVMSMDVKPTLRKAFEEIEVSEDDKEKAKAV